MGDLSGRALAHQCSWKIKGPLAKGAGWWMLRKGWSPWRTIQCSGCVSLSYESPMVRSLTAMA
eukprot:31625-Eustigmatos_ZCMA.PRE.1